MNIQTKASIYKEILAFFRTGKVFIILLSLMGLAAFSPLVYVGLGNMMDAMGDLYDDMGVDFDMSGISGMLASKSSLGVTSSVSDLSGLGLIVFLLLINNAAGGEQKKREIIIPVGMGLRSGGYLIAKYLIYPVAAFFVTCLAMFVSWGVSSLVFEVRDVTFNQALLAAILTALCFMMYVCFHITIGTATGRAGMSAAICIVASFLLPSVFMIAGTDYMFNPFALTGIAIEVINNPELTSGQMTDIIITIAFVIALMFLSYLIALFVRNAKKIDNSGDELEL